MRTIFIIQVKGNCLVVCVQKISKLLRIEEALYRFLKRRGICRKYVGYIMRVKCGITFPTCVHFFYTFINRSKQAICFQCLSLPSQTLYHRQQKGERTSSFAKEQGSYYTASAVSAVSFAVWVGKVRTLVSARAAASSFALRYSSRPFQTSLPSGVVSVSV